MGASFCMRSEMEPLNPSNGWGSYDSLLEMWTKFVHALKAHPDAVLRGCV